MNGVLQVFLVLSMGGLVVSLGVNLLSWVAVPLPAGLMALHGGIFVVFIPAIFAAAALTKDYPQRDYWKAALRGGPAWVEKAVKWLVCYALLNFVAALVMGAAAGGDPHSLRLFSGHWVAFYGCSAALLHSARHAKGVDQRRRCPNGHLVSATASYCERCGSPTGRG